MRPLRAEAVRAESDALYPPAHGHTRASFEALFVLKNNTCAPGGQSRRSAHPGSLRPWLPADARAAPAPCRPYRLGPAQQIGPCLRDYEGGPLDQVVATAQASRGPLSTGQLAFAASEALGVQLDRQRARSAGA